MTRRRVRVFGADEQDDVAVDVNRWVRLAEAVLTDARVRPDSELSVLFVDTTTMTELNAAHMGKDGPTDVLAFPIDDDGFDPGRWPDNGSSGPDRPEPDDIPTLLGDVVVCPAVAAAQASEHAATDPDGGRAIHDGTVEDEIALLVVHGVLHVLGMDHAEPEETAAMQAREQDLLVRFHRS